MSETVKHKNVRSKTAQEIVDGNNVGEVFTDYYSRYPPIEVDPDLDTYNLGEANDDIAQDYRRTLRAHFIEMGAFASLLSYELIETNSQALSRFTHLLEYEDLESSLSQYIDSVDEIHNPRNPFPLPLKQYIVCISNMHTECKEAALGPQCEFEKHYLHTKVDILHSRLHRLYKCLKASPYAEATSMPQRLLGFEPDDRGYTNAQEVSLLRSRQAYVNAAIPFRRSNISDEVAGCLSAETLFAASHAIEVCYPGIDSRDVTQLLLKNVTILSEVARQGSSNKLYHSIVLPNPKDPTVQGTFSAFIHGTTVTEKMVLDNQDRLHIPIIPGNGKCPLGFVYEASKERVEKAYSFYDSIRSKYDVEIPRGLHIDLATEHMAMAILAAEPYINGRAHQIIEDFKRFLFAKAVSKLDLQKGDIGL